MNLKQVMILGEIGAGPTPSSAAHAWGHPPIFKPKNV